MARLIIFFCLYLSSTTYAQQPNDLKNSVQLNATYSAIDKTISLNWENYTNATSYEVYEKSTGSSSWGSVIATVENDTFYTINNVEIGDIKEYRIRRIASDGTAEGYAYTGIQYLPLRFGLKIIVVVEAEIKESLPDEIDRYIRDLESEGLITSEIVVNKDNTALEVKNAIMAVYNTDPFNYKTVSIIGHVPVPYSGNIGPDGHSNHVGAWPCDGYYGDMNGTWTDNSVTNTTASQERNHNIPGDGKWDQSIFPSELEMAVGRVDFANLPLFAESEIELTKRYLDKNHKFRKGQIKSINRGLVENNFGLAEGFGQNGYRNISALVGRDSTFSRDFDALKSDTYLWSYGAGGGNFQGASGISNSTNFSQDSIQSIFTMLFGSYFGDFDSNNNFLRSSLATGTVLSNVWAGRPHWHFHPMGMGSRLGDCVKISMNNSFTYVSGFGTRQAHMALIGDPTLKMTYVESALELNSIQQGNNIQLDWIASTDDDIDGYHIYRKFNNEMPELLDTLISSTSYVDQCVEIGDYTYYISAVRLEEGITGSYYNESPHIQKTIAITDLLLPLADFSYVENELEISFTSNSLNATDHLWEFDDGMFSTDVNPNHTYMQSGVYHVQLTVSDIGNCYSDTLSQELNLMPNSVFEHQLNNLIYPNPVSDLLHVQSQEKILNVIIKTATGSVVNNFEMHQKSVSIDVENYARGVYYLIIETEGKHRYSSKFIKVN